MSAMKHAPVWAILLFGLAVKAPPTPLPGSVSPALGRQPMVLVELNAESLAWSEKSPVLSRGVGTRPELTLPVICRFHSWDQKKKILSFLIGPPTVYPKSLRRSLGVGAPGLLALRLVLLASRTSLRPK